MGPRTARSARARRAGPARRYISAQAYYHALRAALAESRGDLSHAADELQLALVYDHESLHLTLELGRVSLALERVGKARKMAERAQRLAPRDPAAALLAARVAKARGEGRRAERLLRRAERRADGDLEISIALGRLLLDAGRHAEAVPVLRRAAERRPQATAPLEMLAEAHRSAGDLEAASAALERGLRRAPDRIDLLEALTDLYERSGRLADAAERWRSHLDRHPGQWAARLGAARVDLLLDGEAEGAVARLQDRARDPAARRALALTLYEVGRFRAAVSLFEEDGVSTPATALAHGEALRALGLRDRALAQLARIGPDAGRDYERARLGIARMHQLAGRPRRARQALQAGLRNRPDAAVLVAELAVVQARAKEVSLALRGLDEADGRNLDSGPLVQARARVLELRDGRASATEALQDWLRTGSRPEADVRWALARLQLDEGAPRRAEATLRPLAAQRPDDPRVWTARAEAALQDDGRAEAALGFARRALALAPRRPTGLAALGRAYLVQGDVEHARTFLGRAARLSPRDPRIMEHIGDLEHRGGDAAAARAAWRAAKRGWRTHRRADPSAATAALERLAAKLRRSR